MLGFEVDPAQSSERHAVSKPGFGFHSIKRKVKVGSCASQQVTRLQKEPLFNWDSRRIFTLSTSLSALSFLACVFSIPCRLAYFKDSVYPKTDTNDSCHFIWLSLDVSVFATEGNKSLDLSDKGICNICGCQFIRYIHAPYTVPWGCRMTEYHSICFMYSLH